VTLLAAILLLAASPGAPAADSKPCASAYDCAAAQVARHEFAAAIAALEKLLAASPQDLKALNLLGIALTSAGRPDEGSTRFRQALAVDPAFTPARKNLAVNLFARGALDEARREFEAVLKQAPDDEVAHLHLGEIHYARKDLAAAVAH
jgi:Flp pilus assembly protein TadD